MKRYRDSPFLLLTSTHRSQISVVSDNPLPAKRQCAWSRERERERGVGSEKGREEGREAWLRRMIVIFIRLVHVRARRLALLSFSGRQSCELQWTRLSERVNTHVPGSRAVESHVYHELLPSCTTRRHRRKFWNRPQSLLLFCENTDYWDC